MKALSGLFVGALLLCALASSASATATKRVIRPASAVATSTAVPIATVTPAINQPSAQPTCGVKQAQVYGDPNGCLYGCADQRVTTITRPLNVSCVFPTTTATP